MNIQKIKDKLEEATQDVMNKLQFIHPFTGKISVEIEYDTFLSGITRYVIGIKEKKEFANKNNL